MAQTNIPLAVGMKLKIVKGDAPDPKEPTWHLGINWIAGQVPIGAIGTVGLLPKNPHDPTYNAWIIDFPDHPMQADKVARGFYRALMGPNVSDCYEVVA